MERLAILREPERKRLTGLSRVQWWRLEKEGRVPRRVQLGDNSVGWLRNEIQEWISRRAALRAQ